MGSDLTVSDLSERERIVAAVLWDYTWGSKRATRFEVAKEIITELHLAGWLREASNGK